MTTKRLIKNPKKLYTECIDLKPLNFDFNEGYTEAWDIALNLTEQEQENEDFNPMMNYIYPLPDKETFERDMQTLFGDDWPTKIKKQLSNTTLIQLLNEGYTENYYLALTGAGMDFSWEICESYINLGYLPPLHFCDLPNMAGTQYETAKIKRIMQACKRTCDIAALRAKNTKQHLKKLYNYSTNLKEVKE